MSTHTLTTHGPCTQGHSHVRYCKRNSYKCHEKLTQQPTLRTQCECKVIGQSSETDRVSYPTIRYCPLHEQTPAMREALKAAIMSLDIDGPDSAAATLNVIVRPLLAQIEKGA